MRLEHRQDLVAYENRECVDLVRVRVQGVHPDERARLGRGREHHRRLGIERVGREGRERSVFTQAVEVVSVRHQRRFHREGRVIRVLLRQALRRPEPVSPLHMALGDVDAVDKAFVGGGVEQLPPVLQWRRQNRRSSRGPVQLDAPDPVAGPAVGVEVAQFVAEVPVVIGDDGRAGDVAHQVRKRKDARRAVSHVEGYDARTGCEEEASPIEHRRHAGGR